MRYFFCLLIFILIFLINKECPFINEHQIRIKIPPHPTPAMGAGVSLSHAGEREIKGEIHFQGNIVNAQDNFFRMVIVKKNNDKIEIIKRSSSKINSSNTIDISKFDQGVWSGDEGLQSIVLQCEGLQEIVAPISWSTLEMRDNSSYTKFEFAGQFDHQDDKPLADWSHIEIKGSGFIARDGAKLNTGRLLLRKTYIPEPWADKEAIDKLSESIDYAWAAIP